MLQTGYGKKILTLLFILILAMIWIGNDSYAALGKIITSLKQRVLEQHEENAVAMDELETEYASSLIQQKFLINLNGMMAKKLNMQGYYSDIGIYVSRDKYIVSAYEQTSTDYEYRQVLAFKDYLDEMGIQLIYVNEPIKYLEDDWIAEQFGIESYGNRNADLFLQRISESGVNVIDLRDKIIEDGLDIFDMFYRTDHHWKTWSGLWAAKKIAEDLNEHFGYSIDLSIYDETNYWFTDWKECWLGEQGRVVAASYVGLDDYTEIKPKFETSMAFKTGAGLVEGNFDGFVDEDIYNTDVDVYDALSWHYSYSMRNVINNNVSYGKILVLGDSYDHVMVPFLSLGVSEIDILSLRHFEGSLKEYIAEGEYDTVLICYAQFMIGAHDDPQSANYKMFAFD